jgi:hypothetical protein
MIAIQTKRLGPTNHRGSRVVAFTCNGHRIVLDWADAASSDANHTAAAYELARKMGWPGKWVGADTECGLVFVSTFFDDSSFQVWESYEAAHAAKDAEDRQ